MKSEMPSLGVRVPEVRRIVTAAFRELQPGSLEELQAPILELWRGAGWREERYAASDLTGLRLAAGEPGMLPLYEEIIRSGAWWDLVDGVAHRLCDLMKAYREDMTPGAAAL
ncbi:MULTISPECIES: DNA alkylation repair protein [Arthrobacter]|nr:MULTISPECIES: DNA alkylation repair protein [Arthrobacter]